MSTEGSEVIASPINGHALTDFFIAKAGNSSLGPKARACVREGACVHMCESHLSIHNVNPQRNANLGLDRRLSFGGRV